MAKLYLKLRNEDGSFREYRKDWIPARWVKAAMKHSKKLDEMVRKQEAVAVLEERIKFTCEVFGEKELTPDAILDGLSAEELVPVLDQIFNTLMGNGEEKSEGK